MGMTLWVQTLEGRRLSKESIDHSFMHDFADELDLICEELGVAKLSSFHDFTDLEYSASDEFENGEQEEEQIDPETGWGYGIDDMQWFDAAAGLPVLQALRSHLASGAASGFDEQTKAQLIEELDDCISRLNAPATNGGSFHLAVVM